MQRILWLRASFRCSALVSPAICNGRCRAEKWIEEGKNTVKWTRLSYHDLADNQGQPQLFALAYDLDALLRSLALPRSVTQ